MCKWLQALLRSVLWVEQMPAGDPDITFTLKIGNCGVKRTCRWSQRQSNKNVLYVWAAINVYECTGRHSFVIYLYLVKIHYSKKWNNATLWEHHAWWCSSVVWLKHFMFDIVRTHFYCSISSQYESFFNMKKAMKVKQLYCIRHFPGCTYEDVK